MVLCHCASSSCWWTRPLSSLPQGLTNNKHWRHFTISAKGMEWKLMNAIQFLFFHSLMKQTRMCSPSKWINRLSTHASGYACIRLRIFLVRHFTAHGTVSPSIRQRGRETKKRDVFCNIYNSWRTFRCPFFLFLLNELVLMRHYCLLLLDDVICPAIISRK